MNTPIDEWLANLDSDMPAEKRSYLQSVASKRNSYFWNDVMKHSDDDFRIYSSNNRAHYLRDAVIDKLAKLDCRVYFGLDAFPVHALRQQVIDRTMTEKTYLLLTQGSYKEICNALE